MPIWKKIIGPFYGVVRAIIDIFRILGQLMIKLPITIYEIFKTRILNKNTEIFRYIKKIQKIKNINIDIGENRNLLTAA